MRFLAYLLEDIERLKLLEIEREPGDGEVLVKVEAALTCGTDTKMYKRGHPQFPFPSLFGHEVSGIVAEKGKGVGFLKEGDEVLFPVSSPCLSCKYCLKGLENQCENLFKEKVWGAFAEYILIPARIVRNSTFKKPKNLSFEEGALLDPLSSVVFSYRNIKKQDLRVLIIGAGPMGFLHALYSRERGYEVSVCDIKKERLGILEKLNFKTYLSKDGWEEEAGNFDLIMECSGTEKGLKSALKLMEKGGKICIFAGFPKNYTFEIDIASLHYNQNEIYGSFHYDRAAVLEAYNLLLEGNLNLKPLFSGYYHLKQLPSVMDMVLRGEGLKFVINP
ncbi:MAG: alcohol dehydrogenase catalytic domain-containing protein [Thermoanaerobaculia bacterium]